MCFLLSFVIFLFFFFNDTATTEIYTLSLHDALPIWEVERPGAGAPVSEASFRIRRYPLQPGRGSERGPLADRKSTRLNSSHSSISYAVFCLKKKKKKKQIV